MPVFQGQNQIHPGYYSFVNTSGLVNVGILSSGVLAFEGPALGGVPEQIQVFTEPTSARSVLRGGDLLTSIQDAFNEGASLIVAVRTGTPGTSVTQSSVSLPDSLNQNFLTLTSLDYGSYTTGIQVQISAGSISGFLVTVQFIDTLLGITTTETFDNNSSIAAAVSAINNANTGSQLVSASDSGSAVATAVPVNTNGFVSLQGGLDDLTPTLTEWTNALALLDTQTVNIVILAGVTDPSVYALLQSHVDTLSAERKKRIGIVGAALGLPVGVYSNPSSLLGQAYNLNDPRMIYCGVGVDGVSAAFTAAHLGGWLSGRDVATSPTFQNLDVTSLEVLFSPTDVNSLLIGGVVVLEQVPSGRRIARGITTQQDIVPGITEGPYKEITTVRIVDNVDSTLQAALEGKYIGQKGISRNINGIVSDTISLLTQFQENEIIQGFKNVTAVQDPNNPEIVNLSFVLAPVFPINWIFSTINLVNLV